MMELVTALSVKSHCGCGTGTVREHSEGKRPPLEACTRGLVRDSRPRELGAYV
jgi:hypothetical protein